MPASQELPSTLERSEKHAQALWSKAHDSAVKEYGEGDHWERKAENGPSERKAAGGRDTDAPTEEGVDANASKAHLLDIAKRLDISGRTRMTKDELIDEIKRANRRETAAKRKKG